MGSGAGFPGFHTPILHALGRPPMKLAGNWDGSSRFAGCCIRVYPTAQICHESGSSYLSVG